MIYSFQPWHSTLSLWFKAAVIVTSDIGSQTAGEDSNDQDFIEISETNTIF